MEYSECTPGLQARAGRGAELPIAARKFLEQKAAEPLPVQNAPHHIKLAADHIGHICPRRASSTALFKAASVSLLSRMAALKNVRPTRKTQTGGHPPCQMH